MCSKKAPLDPTQGVQDQIVILVNLTTNPEVVTPGDTAVVQAYLFDQEGQPVAGEVVQFSASIGIVEPASNATNDSGVATTVFTAPQDTGEAIITGQYGTSQKRSVTVKITISDSRPVYLDVSAEPPVILADNQSTSLIKAVVSDQNNNPVPDGTQVNFEIIDGTGTIESNKVTTDGMAVSTLTSGTQPDTATVVVRVGLLTDTTTVRYVVGEPATITVVADSTSLPADGVTSTAVTAYVSDAAGNPVADETRVSFVADLGDITPNAQTNSGRAVANFSSSVTGIATIQASVGAIMGETTVQLLPGPPNSILLSFAPNSLGVKDSGRNQTLRITAEVVDSKNNYVLDGTHVAFSIFSSPGGGEFLSSTNPIPTLNGQAQVSLNSGIRSGSVRILAQVTDEFGAPVVPEVRAVSTEIIIFAGPPYIEDVNDPSGSHLSVGVKPLNVFGWNVVNNTASVTAVVGDKFNNPVPPGTAVFFTTTAGVISTYAGFTDKEGVATVTIHTAQPYPTISRFYNTFFDPNEDHPDFNKGTNVIPGPIPDFEGGEVLNSIGDYGENDGIARILAVTEGVDANGNSARVWSVTSLVFSGLIDVFDIEVSDTDLSPGESALITFKIYDVNGNPIVPGSEIAIRSSAGELSWTSLNTGDPGVTRYQVLLTNNIDPSDPEAQAATTTVTITVNSQNGNVINSSEPINLNLN
ncbi:MAG: invasin domain 3-containing protein [bacterium]